MKITAYAMRCDIKSDWFVAVDSIVMIHPLGERSLLRYCKIEIQMVWCI